MQLSTTATLLAFAAAQAQAFSNSSPFILFSTAKLFPEAAAESNAPAQLQTSAQALASAKELLASCPTKHYLLASVPDLHAADIRGDGSGECHMPNLCRAVRAAGDGHSFSVAEVVGVSGAGPVLAEHIAAACADAGRTVKVDQVDLARLPKPSAKEGSERREVLEDNDHELDRLLDALEDDYTLVLFSDSTEPVSHEPEFVGPIHTDMKRSVEERRTVAKRKSDSSNKLPLFEKYQFFTPGIFMAFVVLAVLLSILAVGLKSVASLEVSYGAFDKEMGPAAQKKQM